MTTYLYGSDYMVKSEIWENGEQVSEENPVPVSDAGGSITVDGSVTLGAGTAAIGKLAANNGVNIGDVGVASVAMPSAIYAGRKTLAATGVAEALGASQALKVGVTIKALAANMDTVDIGQSDVGADAGYPLSAGEEAFFSIDDLSTLYVIGTEGDGVAYHAE